MKQFTYFKGSWGRRWVLASSLLALLLVGSANMAPATTIHAQSQSIFQDADAVLETTLSQVPLATPSALTRVFFGNADAMFHADLNRALILAQPLTDVFFGNADAQLRRLLMAPNAVPQNQPPNADAGLDQSVLVGETVQLAGRGSSDPDNGPQPLTYNWQITSKPPGSVASLSDPSLVNPTFVADVVGDYAVELVVNDGDMNSNPALVTIVVNTHRILWVPVKYKGEQDDLVLLSKLKNRMALVREYYVRQSAGLARIEFEQATLPVPLVPDSSFWIELDETFEGPQGYDADEDGRISGTDPNCDNPSEAASIRMDVDKWLTNNNRYANYRTDFDGLYIVQTRGVATDSSGNVYAELHSHVCSTSVGSFPIGLVQPGDNFGLHAHEIGHLAFAFPDLNGGDGSGNISDWGVMGTGGASLKKGVAPVAPVIVFNRARAHPTPWSNLPGRFPDNIEEFQLGDRQEIPLLKDLTAGDPLCCWLEVNDVMFIFEGRLPFDGLSSSEFPDNTTSGAPHTLQVKEDVLGVNVYKVDNPRNMSNFKINRLGSTAEFGGACFPSLQSNELPTLNDEGGGIGLDFCDGKAHIKASLDISGGKLFVTVRKRLPPETSVTGGLWVQEVHH